MSAKHLISEKLIAEFANYINTFIGLYYPIERWNELEKTLLLAIQNFEFTNPEKFIEWLKQNMTNKKVISFFARHLTISETYFFRDTQFFSALEHQILPDILNRHRYDRKIRIWCAGCCTGQEPYSIVILLHRLLKDFKNWNIFVLGSDLNQEFLRQAQRARYKPWSFRSTPNQILETYFTKNSDLTFSLIPEIRDKVTFNYINLVEQTYPHIITKTQEMDLVLCQNVLIYFSKQQIEKTAHQLVDTLQNQGWLGVSAIEVPFVKDNRLRMRQFDGTVFFKKEMETVENFASKKATSLKKAESVEMRQRTPPFVSHFLPSKDQEVLSLTSKESSKKQANQRDESEEFYQQCLSLSQEKKYGEAIEKLLAYFSSHRRNASFLKQHIKELILFIHLYANQGSFSQALEWCEQALKLEKLNPELYYLHAMILHALNHQQQAKQSLMRTIFLDPKFVIAYYLLGLIEQGKNGETAARSFKTAAELLEEYQSDDIVPGTDELTAGCLKDLILHLLERS